VIELLERLLPEEEPEAGRVLADILRDDGVELRLGTEAQRVGTDGAEVTLSLGREELRGDALLVAVGRRRSVDGLGLDALGVALEGGYLRVDGRARTSLSHIFAAGDVTGGLQFTHVAAHEGPVAGLNAAGRRAKIDERVTPRIEQRTIGFEKLVTAKRRVLGRLGGGELVGAQIVGPHAGELIQECALAMQARFFAGRLTETIHPYPARTLAVQQAAAQLFPLGRAVVENDERYDNRRAERRQAVECADRRDEVGTRDIECREGETDNQHRAGSAPGHVPLAARRPRGRKVDARDRQPQSHIPADDQHRDPDGKQVLVGRGGGRDAQQRTVDRTVDPGAEAARFSAPASQEAVGDVAHTGGDHGETKCGWRERRQHRDRACPQESDRVRNPRGRRVGAGPAARACPGASPPSAARVPTSPPRRPRGAAARKLRRRRTLRARRQRARAPVGAHARAGAGATGPEANEALSNRSQAAGLKRLPLCASCLRAPASKCSMKEAPLALLAAMVVAGCGTHGSNPPAGAGSSVPRFDLSTQHGRAVLEGFDPRYLVAGASPESIPAIMRPRFESPSVASRLLGPTDFVIGVAIDGVARAYPVKLLALHEVVNDVVGGRPIIVTWCPLCSSALVFDRRVGGKTLTFGVSGFLYQANQVLYDLQTRSLWSQLAEGAVTGAMRGQRLKLLPAVEQPWSAWRSAHPATRALSIRRDRFASRFIHPYTYFDSRGEESSDDPYESYVQKVPVYYGRIIDGISGATRVVAVQRHGRSKAYPALLLLRRTVVDDAFAGVPLTVFWSDADYAPRVFSRRLDGRVLHFRREGNTIRDTATGSQWSASTGTSIAGRLAGKSLQPLSFTYPYWFAWHSFHPGTEIAKAPQ
jgi:Protein of unknown function (DUF3179)/Pyridine nucleotide-disulphide oxidoreductase/Pyridine nucleotide-disulphide oxidoreductase, dimerisation domain